MVFSFDRFMRGLASGSDTGLAGIAKPYVESKTQGSITKGIGQIRQGDWDTGLNTISEWSPETALNLAKQKEQADSQLAMARYNNEQLNARQERQIEAARQARQDEFNNRLAAFNYQNQINSDTEKNRLAELDMYIDNLQGLDDNTKQVIKASSRGINMPQISEVMMNRLLQNPNDADARTYFENQTNAKNWLKGMVTPDPISVKDKSDALGKINTAVQNGIMTPEQGSEAFKTLTGEQVDFSAPAKKYESGDVGTMQYLVDNGYSLDNARRITEKLTPEEKLNIEQFKNNITTTGQIKVNAANAQNLINLENIKNINAEKARQQQFYNDLQKIELQNQLNKDFETFKSQLPSDYLRKVQEISNITGKPVEELLANEYDMRQVELSQKLADIDYKNAQTVKTLRENAQPYVSPIDEYRQKAEINAEIQQQNEAKKAQFEKEQSQKQSEAMRPRVMQAIMRAEDALKDGAGLGQLGGWGWTSETGGKNRAAIQAAQAQINIAMRGLLKEMGVGSTEMNSAVEAVAYRYTISPDMPISQIKQVLDNFKQDYLDGTFQNELQTIASQYGGTQNDIVGQKIGNLTIVGVEE